MRCSSRALSRTGRSRYRQCPGLQLTRPRCCVRTERLAELQRRKAILEAEIAQLDKRLAKKAREVKAAVRPLLRCHLTSVRCDRGRVLTKSFRVCFSNRKRSDRSRCCRERLEMHSRRQIA